MHIGHVERLTRFPVKSMLGETCETLSLSARGVEGDRAFALIDAASGKVASAKRPKLWKRLLTCSARTGDQAEVEIAFPDGLTRNASDPGINEALSLLTGRPVRLTREPPMAAQVDRSHPDAQLAEGVDADVGSDILVLGAAAPQGSFLDYAPVHVLTTATLDGLADDQPGGAIEADRFRPNILIRSLDGAPRFPENDWLGGLLRIGSEVQIRIVLQTPRCAIPMLAHGALPERPDAVRRPAERNRIEIPGFGLQPCAGAYADVLRGGAVRNGDPVDFLPA